jgi:NADPH:quinone reductase-like Zn-dependent oxidoreductase
MESNPQHSEYKQVKYHDGQYKLFTEHIHPKPGPGHVLIRIAYSTINPYDRNMYTNTKTDGF